VSTDLNKILHLLSPSHRVIYHSAFLDTRFTIEYRLTNNCSVTTQYVYVCIFRELELVRRKERNEAHLYMTVDVYVEDDFQSHQGPDLLDFDDVKPK